MNVFGRNIAKGGLTAAALVVLSACTVGPDFHHPETASPTHFSEPAGDTPSRPAETPVDEAWWGSFGDAELSSLIDRLTRQNLDLKSASERILQARAQRQVAASEGLPHLGGRVTYIHERESANGQVSLLVPAPGAPLEFDQADDALQASWELDLFGRVRRSVEAADANAEVAVEDRHAIALSAVAELAQTYMQLRGMQARERVLRQNLEATERRRALVRNRLDNGVATISDVAQSDAQSSLIAEDLPTLAESEARLVNAIGLLLAEPPRSLRAELTPYAAQPLVPPAVPIGLPSALLRRRPDIREAEAQLHVATAETGVAVAAFYPDVSLNGSLGTEALGVDHLFDAASRMFMIGPSVSLPIFEGGQLRGQLELRRAEQREAAISYRKTVLQAWHDVDNALTAYSEIQNRRERAVNVAHDAAISLQVAEQRYAQGVESFIDVTSAQSDVFRAEDGVAQATASEETNLVALYKALGGGWLAADAPEAFSPQASADAPRH